MSSSKLRLNVLAWLAVFHPQKRNRRSNRGDLSLPACPSPRTKSESLTKPESLMTSPQATSLMSTVLSSLWPQAKQKAPTGPAADDGVCRHRGGDKVGCEVWPPEDAPAAAPATPPAALVGGIGGMADPLSISQLTVDFWLSRATPDGMLTQKRTRAQLKQHAAQGEVEETLLEMTEPAYLLGRLQQVWCRMEQDPTLFGLTAESIETFKAEAGDGLRHIHVRFEQETERPDAPRDCFAREARISGAKPTSP